jgi:hypothetical protein
LAQIRAKLAIRWGLAFLNIPSLQGLKKESTCSVWIQGVEITFLETMLYYFKERNLALNCYQSYGIYDILILNIYLVTAKSKDELLEEMLFPIKALVHVSIQWGKTHEDRARTDFELQEGVKVCAIKFTASLYVYHAIS